MSINIFHRNSGHALPIVKTSGLLPAIALAVFLCGCGSETGSRSILSVTQPGAGYGIVDESNGGGGGSTDTPFAGSQGTAAIVSSQVSSTGGAQIVCGRHTLTIPPGALKTDEQITLIDLTGIRGYACVQILPQDIHFKQKATLESEVADLLDPQTGEMYWGRSLPHNRVGWSQVGGSIPVNGTAVSAGIGRTGMFAVDPAF